MEFEKGILSETKTVLIISQEGENFEIPVEIAKMSGLLKAMIQGNTILTIKLV